MDRKTFLRSLGGSAFLGAAMVVSGPNIMLPKASAVPIIGRKGLVPNANNLTDYISMNYPGVMSIGGVRSDPLPDHPSGHAIDIMVGGKTSLGNAIHSDIMSNRSRFGIKYTLWQVSRHYDHIHVTVY